MVGGALGGRRDRDGDRSQASRRSQRGASMAVNTPMEQPTSKASR
ncbi:hypothetical protein ACFQX6_59260 [Streptosporangium lutulentum]